MLFIRLPLAHSDQSVTTIKIQLKLKKGVASTLQTGKASYAHSYVYVFKALEGQRASIIIKSRDNSVAFSLISPTTETIAHAFVVNHWEGVLPSTGNYSVVGVMNQSQLDQVPFTLKISISSK